MQHALLISYKQSEVPLNLDIGVFLCYSNHTPLTPPLSDVMRPRFEGYAPAFVLYGR